MLRLVKSLCRRVIPKRLWERLALLKWRILAKRAYLARHRRLERSHLQAAICAHEAPTKVFIIVVDCLRRDALSLHGNPRRTTPFLDALAEDGSSAVALQNFYGSSGWTYPAVASMLSGLYPHNHGAVYATKHRKFNEGQVPNRMRDDVTLLPDLFEQLGYDTYFVSRNVVAFEAVRGAFAHHYAERGSQPAGSMFQLAQRLALQSPRQRQFFYCHDMTLHEPLKELPSSYDGLFDGSVGKLSDAGWRFGEGQVDRDSAQFRRYAYERQLHYHRCLRLVDDRLKDLLGAFRRAGLLDECLFVITSDHGEEFWDHAEVEAACFDDPSSHGIAHGHNLFQETVHLPCVLWRRRLQEALGRGISSMLLSHVDLFNLTCHLAGVSGDWGQNDGIDFSDSDSHHPWVLAEDVSFGFEKKAVIRPPYKLLVSEGDDVRWLLNIEEDPGEEVRLQGPQSVVEELSGALSHASVDTGVPMEVDEGTRERLRHLGYLD
ncbi:MAG: sulfatase-like hydrolase/transferase [Planctomycetota bacterium]|jgi:arylsulfatase A-like enzyme